MSPIDLTGDSPEPAPFATAYPLPKRVAVPGILTGSASRGAPNAQDGHPRKKRRVEESSSGNIHRASAGVGVNGITKSVARAPEYAKQFRHPAPAPAPAPAQPQLQHTTYAAPPPSLETPKKANLAIHSTGTKIPESTRRPHTVKPQISPANYRTRARNLEFRQCPEASNNSTGDGPKKATKAGASDTTWFRLDKKPYLTADVRAQIGAAVNDHKVVLLRQDTLPFTYHVDFSHEEVEYVRQHARAGYPLKKQHADPLRELGKIVRRNAKTIVKELPKKIEFTGPLSGRSEGDLYNFLHDTNFGAASRQKRVYTLRRDTLDTARETSRANRVPSLLLDREINGRRRLGGGSNFGGLRNNFLRVREDGLELRAEWTNCAGDVATISWVSNTSFICGTTAHSDSHNQQYNKPGNLLVCSTTQGTLRAYPDHRIVRPVVAKGENSTEAMRQSQDPWLYSSVVSSAYDDSLDLAYTSSFDRTVKVWEVEKPGSHMRLMGTWLHDGNVNFVVVSRHPYHLVATAADVAVDAVRIYKVDRDNVYISRYHNLGGRVGGPVGHPLQSELYAYFPATIQWGRADVCSHHLLVGYSPRSYSGDDGDIPADKRTTGVMRLFDAMSGRDVSIGIPLAQDVFEVAWHPSKPVFIVATSVGGNKAEANVRTQIRVFALSQRDSATQLGVTDLTPIDRIETYYGFVQILDCYSSDINEISLQPTSHSSSYVTAATTDGKVYVWDTAQGHVPMHVLSHGKPLEEMAGDQEKEDFGVKFVAWGSTLDRLYTGGSDGVVKVWNVRHKKPLVRDLLEASGPISAGAFSFDYSKLAIGDASGRVYLLSTNKDDDVAGDFIRLPEPRDGSGPGIARPVRRPRPYIPHPEPPPPPGYLDLDTGVERARQYLKQGQLIRHSNPVLGVFQGPGYEALGLYRAEAHLDEDPRRPLLSSYERNQKANTVPRQGGFSKPRSFGSRASNNTQFTKWILSAGDADAQALHKWNCAADLDLRELAPEVRAELAASGVDLRYPGPDWDLDFEGGGSDGEGASGNKDAAPDLQDGVEEDHVDSEFETADEGATFSSNE